MALTMPGCLTARPRLHEQGPLRERLHDQSLCGHVLQAFAAEHTCQGEVLAR